MLTWQAPAQVSDRVASVSAGTAQTGQPLTIHATLLQPQLVARVELAYRRFGETTFGRIEMTVTGNDAAATIPGTAVSPPFVEYYLLLSLHTPGPEETYPVENAAQQPLRAAVSEPAEAQRLVILSPEPGERVRAADLLISFSLINFDSTLDPSRTVVIVDAEDVSARAVVSGDLVVLRPGEGGAASAEGTHALRIEVYDRSGKLLERAATSFATAPGGLIGAPAGPHWTTASSVILETRNENISDVSTPYNRATLAASGQYEQYRVRGRLYLTNEEEEERQPQNRYLIAAEAPWLALSYGDAYPAFPSLVMNGKRVRGFNGSLTLGAFNLDVAKGEITRSVASDTVKTFPASSLAAEQSADPSGAYGLYNASTNTWAKFLYGTFSRDLLAVRPSFGRRDDSHMGFTYLKSTDDMGSIRFGTRPEENLVVGTDMLLLFDRRNIELSGEAAFSATNRDITNGTFDNARIDSIFGEYSEAARKRIRDIRDIVSRFITVNENLVPLNARHMPTLAYEGSLGLNYLANNFRFTYLRRGESYESFGQSFLRTDVAGFNLNDRVRLANSRLFLSGGFERLTDNTAQSKAATTAMTTANAGLSYFPGTDIPNMTLAYVHASNANDLPHADTVYAVDDGTDRVIVQLGKEFPYLGGRQSASLSVSTSTRDDRTARDFDTKNTSVILSDAATWPYQLQTLLSLSVNASTFGTSGGTFGGAGLPSQSLSYTTLTANARWTTLENRLFLTAALSPTFGDIERTVVEGGAQYSLMPNISIATNLSCYFNSKLFGTAVLTNDVIWSIVLRADM